ncbi:MAG: hypothetical protein V3V62_02850 [bacterium]
MLTAFAMIAFLGGCTTTTTTWVKTGSAAQAAKDLKACAKKGGVDFSEKGEKGGPVAFGFAGAFDDKCMTGKGYKKGK